MRSIAEDKMRARQMQPLALRSLLQDAAAAVLLLPVVILLFKRSFDQKGAMTTSRTIGHVVMMVSLKHWVKLGSVEYHVTFMSQSGSGQNDEFFQTMVSAKLSWSLQIVRTKVVGT